MKKLFSVVALLTLCSCTTYPPSVSLTHALSSIEDDLVSHHTLPIDHYTTWNIDTKLAFQKGVLKEQCRQGISDPLIPTFMNPFTLNLTGSFTTSGGFQVSSPSLSIPTIGANGTDSKSKSQGISLAISITSLSALPDVEEQVMVTRAGGLLGQNDSNRDVVSKSIIAEKTAFSSYIQTLITGYSPQLCATIPQTKDDGPLYVGIKHK